MNYIKLSDYAKQFGCCYRTAWNRFKSGKIEGAYLDSTNHVLVPVGSVNFNQTKKVALYARILNNENNDLDKKIEYLTKYAISNGYNIQYSIKEIGSDTDDTRSQLIKLINKDDFDFIVVENKEQLASCGYNYIQVLLHKLNKGIIVINQNKKV